MKREQARLEALQSLSYQDDVQTAEWQETQTAAIKRAGNRCQVCSEEHVPLSAYHTASSRLGCEHESDVLVLCEACFDRLADKLGAGEDRPEETAGEEQGSPAFSWGKKATIFGGSALVTMGLPALLHAPLPAEIFGLGAALALATKSPQLYAEMRDALPQPLVELVDGMAARKRARAAAGEWSLWDRLWARHLKETPPDRSGEPDPLTSQQDFLDLGPTLKPHADRLLSGRKVILGTSGSGKTNTMNVYCEELAKLRPAPAIILFDTDDENRALCNRAYLPRPVWQDRSRGLTAENACASAQTIMERRYQCIINLQSYEDEEAAWIMINMIKGVRAWQEAREVRLPCEFVLDEASVWLPQNPRESALSSILVDDPDAPLEEDAGQDRGKATKKISLLALVQRAFFSTVVRRGRRRGMGFTLAAQRIAEIDKRALQGSWMFLMRQTQPADFREYQKYGITPEEAMGLFDGEAFVFAPGKPREKHRLRESVSPHGGVTPGMQALRGAIRGQGAARPSPEPAPGSLAPSVNTQAEVSTQTERSAPSLEAILDAVLALQLQGKAEEQATDATGTPRSRPRETARSEEVGNVRRPGTGHPKELRDALAVLEPGMTYRELGATLGYGEREARELWQELRRRGLLRAPMEATERNVAQQHGLTARAASSVRPLYPLPHPAGKPQQEAVPARSMDVADLAKAFALWQTGASSVRKLEAAAKAAGYGWSNGKCRLLIEDMEKCHLIQGQKRETGAM